MSVGDRLSFLGGRIIIFAARAYAIMAICLEPWVYGPAVGGRLA